MAVRHYAREYAIRIKEKNQDSADDSDNGELEDHYPLIRQTEKDLTIINADIYKGIDNGLRSSSKIISSSVSMAMVMPMSTEVAIVYSYMPS
ncbi:hypothetical protein M0804_005562 [Polistes exclamans]|nr:hypothetical protein M0804_005562 [Polistes exclamans]